MTTRQTMVCQIENVQFHCSIPRLSMSFLSLDSHCSSNTKQTCNQRSRTFCPIPKFEFPINKEELLLTRFWVEAQSELGDHLEFPGVFTCHSSYFPRRSLWRLLELDEPSLNLDGSNSISSPLSHIFLGRKH